MALEIPFFYLIASHFLPVAFRREFPEGLGALLPLVYCFNFVCHLTDESAGIMKVLGKYKGKRL